ncbi:nucleoside-diphosphate kinase [Amycolatopsis sp. NPDC004772]
MERTLVLLKPDAYARGLLGQLTSEFEQKGLLLVGCKLMMLDDSLLQEHYAHLADRPFFPRIARFMSSLPVLVQCWEGVDAVEVVRRVVGPTNGREAASGTARGQYSVSVQCNLVHASDSAESAAAEVKRFFAEGEVLAVKHPLHDFIYAADEQ